MNDTISFKTSLIGGSNASSNSEFATFTAYNVSSSSSSCELNMSHLALSFNTTISMYRWSLDDNWRALEDTFADDDSLASSSSTTSPSPRPNMSVGAFSNVSITPAGRFNNRVTFNTTRSNGSDPTVTSPLDKYSAAASSLARSNATFASPPPRICPRVTPSHNAATAGALVRSPPSDALPAY